MDRINRLVNSHYSEKTLKSNLLIVKFFDIIDL